MNYNIMKGLDFGVYAAYGWLGDGYKVHRRRRDGSGQPVRRPRPPELRVLKNAGGKRYRKAPGGNPGGFPFRCRKGGRALLLNGRRR